MAATPSSDKPRLTISELERLKTHELADLLSSFVVLLRQLPDMPFNDLAQEAKEHQTFMDVD